MLRQTCASLSLRRAPILWGAPQLPNFPRRNISCLLYRWAQCHDLNARQGIEQHPGMMNTHARFNHLLGWDYPSAGIILAKQLCHYRCTSLSMCGTLGGQSKAVEVVPSNERRPRRKNIFDPSVHSNASKSVDISWGVTLCGLFRSALSVCICPNINRGVYHMHPVWTTRLAGKVYGSVIQCHGTPPNHWLRHRNPEGADQRKPFFLTQLREWLVCRGSYCIYPNI